MRFAKWVFLLAGITGILMVLPPYFLEEQFGRDHPPPVNHPELYYGFFGVTLSWQMMFLVIGSDPIRFRTAMLPSMLEKASFAVAIPILYGQGASDCHLGWLRLGGRNLAGVVPHCLLANTERRRNMNGPQVDPFEIAAEDVDSADATRLIGERSADLACRYDK